MREPKLVRSASLPQERAAALRDTALDVEDRDGAYETACSILAHLEIMIEMAEDAGWAARSRHLLYQAQAEAQRLVAESEAGTGPRRH